MLPMVSVPVTGAMSYVFENLEAGEHFFAVSALSTLGGESRLSEIASAQFD